MRRRTKIAIAATSAATGAAAIAARAAGKYCTEVGDQTAMRDRAARVGEPGVDGDAFLHHLAEAIRITTVVYVERDRNDPQDIYAIHEFLAATYPRTHERCTVETVNDLSLLYTWHGTDPKADPILVMAHMDVVPIEPGTEDDWAVDPFSGAIVDGYLWGRGALDDKGPMIAIMEAVEHLVDDGFEPTRSVMITFGHDEELGGAHGAANVARLLTERGVHPWFVVDEGGAVADSLPPLTESQVALVKTAEKGYVDLELTATADGGHSSIPPRTTAIGALSQAIHRLESHPAPAHIDILEPMFEALGPYLDPKLRPILTNLKVTGPIVTKLMSARPSTDATIRTSTAVTMISGGVKPNVLPQEARAVVNFRIIPGESIASTVEHVRRVVGTGIAIEPYGEMRAEPSAVSSTASEAWQVLETSIEETFPEAVVAPWTLTGATDSRYFADIAGDIYGFAPFTGDVDATFGSIHGTGERIRISDAEAAVSFFCRLIRNAS
ncbi:hypothetical protein MNBD_ACTINO01-1701 [hydrothermal vent metagenome]|uniref:Peptidase M20 dimerisation domain-containing protein n=1 Tax=hydrothermal vent metagenome TaxID=652676 RepID=A0A3B0S4K0_9ZZZZ